MLTLTSSHWGFKKGDVVFGRKTGDTTHTSSSDGCGSLEMRKKKKYVFSYRVKKEKALLFFCVAYR